MVIQNNNLLGNILAFHKFEREVECLITKLQLVRFCLILISSKCRYDSPKGAAQM